MRFMSLASRGAGLGLASIVLTVASIGLARAESEQACNHYAREAVDAQRANMKRASCGLRGDMWSENYSGHFNWCRQQPPQVVAAESRRRLAALTECTQRSTYCTRYANAAVAAQRVNESTASCRKQGPRWSLAFDNHYRWCLGQHHDVAEREHQAREADVRHCSYAGAPKPPGQFAGNRVEGIELVRDAGNGGTVPVTGNTTFLSQASLCGRWAASQPQINQLIQNLARGRQLLNGIRIRSDARSQVTATCTARAEMAGGGIRIDIKLPRNIFFFHLTQPTILGSWADPEFSITYDVDAVIFIRIPANTGQPFGIELRATVSNIRPDSQNTSGDMVKAVAMVVDLFTGGEVSRRVPGELPFRQAVTQPLDQISKAVPAGLRLEQSPSPNRPTLVLRATGQAPYYPPLR